MLVDFITGGIEFIPHPSEKNDKRITAKIF